MEKRVTFKSAWLPWLLLAPQVTVISVFFFWPAAQTLIQSFQQQDAFGTSVQWITTRSICAVGRMSKRDS